MRGFTLVELMLGLAVAGIVLSAAVPGFVSVVRDNRMTTAANTLVAAINFARLEAVRRGADVHLSSASGGADYAAGWRIWVDANGDGARGADEDLRIGGALKGDTEAVSLDGDADIPFNSRGESRLDHVARIEVCPGGGLTRGRLVRVEISGRVAVLRDYTCS